MYLACLLATLAAFSQDPPHEPTMLERIDALIAKTNACEGFVVRYRVHHADGSESALRLAYRAPAEMVCDIQQGEKIRSFNRISATSMDIIGIQDGAAASKASVRDWNSSAKFVEELRDLLAKEFPAALRAGDLSARESPVVELTIDPDNSAMNFSFGVGTSRDPRLGWLERAHRKPESVSMGGAAGKDLVLPYTEMTSVYISTETGFITRIEKRTETGVRCGLELVDLETEARPGDAQFELPQLGEGVPDTSEDLADVMEGQWLSFSRDDLFRTLARTLDDGRLEWNEQSPEKIERVMRSMHAVDFAPVCTRLLRSEVAWIEKTSDTLREALQGSDPAMVAYQKEQMGRARQKLESQLSSFLEREIVKGMPRGNCRARPSLYEELGAMERRILTEIFTETVTKAVLETFDEKLAKQFDAK